MFEFSLAGSFPKSASGLGEFQNLGHIEQTVSFVISLVIESVLPWHEIRVRLCQILHFCHRKNGFEIAPSHRENCTRNNTVIDAVFRSYGVLGYTCYITMVG